MLLFIIWIIVQYLYSDQPILSTYASSCLLLCIISCWLTINIFKHESLNEKYLLIIQLESKVRYLLSKWIFIFLTNSVLIIFSILYPILIQSFKHHVSIKEILLSFILHIIVCMTGILISTLVININGLSNKYTFLFISLFIVVCILRPFIIQTYPILRYLLWLFPPIGDFMTLFNTDNPNNNSCILWTFLSLIYIIILFIINVIIFVKSDHIKAF